MAETLSARKCSRRNVVRPTAIIRPPDRNDPSHFWADGRTFTGTPANVPCPCGSGRRYRDCHQHNE
nr:SEC-C metal-binding domain-containing protein [Bifidobacterium pseudolongum]